MKHLPPAYIHGLGWRSAKGRPYGRRFGLHRLQHSMEIDGTRVSPTFVYEGKNASASGWIATVGGEDLDLASTGTDPTYDEAVPWVSEEDRSVSINGGEVFEAPQNSPFGLGENDFVLEAVLEFPADSTFRYACGIRAGGVLWALTQTTGNKLQLILNDGSTQVLCLSKNTLSSGWLHCICFGDRSADASMYIDGTNEQATAISTVGGISPAAPWVIGARPDSVGSSKWSGGLAFFALWQSSGWLSDSTNDGIASSRYSQLVGL